MHGRDGQVPAAVAGNVSRLPPAWRPALSRLLDTLRHNLCEHNDLDPAELLVGAQGQLRLADGAADLGRNPIKSFMYVTCGTYTAATL